MCSTLKLEDILSDPTKELALLIGNGFSKEFWETFGYESLFKEAKKQSSFSSYLSLFEFLQTKNFEEVLRSLEFTSLVANNFKFNDSEIERIGKAKTDIREIFFNTIYAVHPSFDKIQDRLCGLIPRLKKFSRIFSTNYDLLLYWAVFFSEGSFTDRWICKDDEPNFFRYDDHYLACTHIYFLHGALYLGMDKFGNLEKVTVSGASDLLTKFKEKLDEGDFFPMYVAEGTFEKKLRKIKSIPYLSMAYQKFREMYAVRKSGYIKDLIIIGHSLNKKFDDHIVEAIRLSQISNIYYGLHNQKQKHEKENYLRELFPNTKKIYFFNSEEFFIL